jgi:hypothetical protein
MTTLDNNNVQEMRGYLELWAMTMIEWYPTPNDGRSKVCWWRYGF